jgi:hypothetical protein
MPFTWIVPVHLSMLKCRKLEASLEQSQNETESLMKERENLQLKVYFLFLLDQYVLCSSSSNVLLIAQINQLEKSNHSLCAVFESQLSHLQAKFSGVTALMNQKQSEIQQQRQVWKLLFDSFSEVVIIFVDSGADH